MVHRSFTAAAPVLSRLALPLLCGAVALAACAPAPTQAPSGGASGAGPTAQAQASQTLVTVVRIEPASLADKPVTATGAGVNFVTRVFNAELDIVDSSDQPHAYLA